MDNKKIPLDKIRIDGGTQSRVELDADYVGELAEDVRSLPWMIVYFDGSDYWLADGFHRYHAYRKAGIEATEVKVEKGTQRDAILYSLQANARHGRRRSAADKRKAVDTLLGDDEWSGWSVNLIAQKCAVSHRFVAEIKALTSQNGSENVTYRTKHGTTATMKTGNIGQKPATAVSEPIQPVETFDGPEEFRGEDFPDAGAVPDVTEKSEVADVPWSEFVTEIDAIQTILRSAGGRLSKLLAFDGKRSTNKWGYYMSHDATCGQINGIVRYLNDYSPAGVCEKPPGFYPHHSAELRRRAV